MLCIFGLFIMAVDNRFLFSFILFDGFVVVPYRRVIFLSWCMALVVVVVVVGLLLSA